MTQAFVVGNGRSRRSLNLCELQNHGTVYGCNALYREFVPDVLVASDRGISEQIQHTGYAQRHCFYTRRPLPNLGARRIHDRYWGYSSGQIAMAQAALDQHSVIFLLGFDLGSVDQWFNNVYADTEFYKRSTARPTYSGNWRRQMLQIMRDFPRSQFVRVQGTESTVVPELDTCVNYSTETVMDFCARFQLTASRV